MIYLCTCVVFILLMTHWTSGHEAGNPLFLTSYIEANNITEGRKFAQVPFTDDLRIKSYAGFFTINKEYDSNMFFWYFPAMASNTATAPVLVWLQGGPGFSSLLGLLTENGPIRIRDGKFERRKYHWALNHHIIYFDNPIGTGFSFTNLSKGYRTEETQIGDDLYSAVIQFLKLFPELKENKLFVTGESYGGKYVPALAYSIHKKNPTAKLKVNLQGIALGNALCDPVNQMLYSKYLYQIGLLDYNQAKVVERYENKIVDLIKRKEWLQAYDLYNNLLINEQLKNKTVFTKLTGFDYYYNYLHSKAYISFLDDLRDMLDKHYVRQGLHVGSLPFHNDTEVARALEADWMKSVAPWLAELIDNYQVLVYNGQLDIIVAYPMTDNYLRKLDFRANEEFKRAKKFIWKVNGEIAGYAKRAGNLVVVLVRDAGHMVPTDQPIWALDLITRFTEGRWNELGRLQRSKKASTQITAAFVS